MKKLLLGAAALSVLAGQAFAQQTTIGYKPGSPNTMGAVQCGSGLASQCPQNALIDSGANDATDPTHHSIKVTAPLAYTMLGTPVQYNLAGYGSLPAAYGTNTTLCQNASPTPCAAQSMTFAFGGAHVTGFKVWFSDKGAWVQGSLMTIRTWSHAPIISESDQGAYSITGSQYWTGDFNCTFNAPDTDGITGNCASVGPLPDLPQSTLYYLIFTTSGSNTPTQLAPTAWVTPEGSQ